MIYLIDFVSEKEGHLIFNTSFTTIIQKIYPNEKICFYGYSDHIVLLKEYFNNSASSEITFKEFHSTNKSNSNRILKWLRKTYNDLLLFKNVFTGGNDMIYIYNAHVVLLIAISFIKRFNSSNSLVFNIVHGEVEYIYTSSNVRERILGVLYRLFLKLASSEMYFILLNKISKSILIGDRYLKDSKTIEINHPYLFNKVNLEVGVSEDLPLVLAHIGSMGLRKNSHYLYKIAENHKENVINGCMQFWAVGAIDSNMDEYSNEFVKTFVNVDSKNKYISRDIYDSCLSKITYAVFFFSPTQFVFRASGAVLDVLEYDKPIIALKNPYFEYLFNEAGDIGFLCNSLEELDDLIGYILKQKLNMTDKYMVQVGNIKAYKDKISIQSVAEDLKEQFMLIK